MIPKAFARLENNLRRAAHVLLLEIVGGVSLAFLLPRWGIERDWIAPLVCVVNLPAAWFLAQAARRQGHNAWLAGLSSIPPMLALINFLSLWATSRAPGGER